MKKMIKWCAAALVAAVMSIPAYAQDTAAKRFEDTTKYLDKGGLAFQYLDAGTVINGITDSAFKLLDQYCIEAQDVMVKNIVKDIVEQSGIRDIRGSGSSIIKNGDSYVVKSFLAIDTQKQNTNLIVNLFTTNSASEMTKFITKQDAIALSTNVNGAVIWKLIDTNVKKYVKDEQQQAQYAMALAQVQVFAGMPANELISSLQGAGLFVKFNKKTDGTHNIPTITILIDMKEKAVCDKLITQLSTLNPEMIKDGKFTFPVQEFGQNITIGTNGKYIYATTDVNDVNARLAQQAAGLNVIPANAAVTSWIYTAPNVGSDIVQFLEQYNVLTNPKEKKLANTILNVCGLNTPNISCTTRTPEGFLSVTGTNSAVLAFYLGSPQVNSFFQSLMIGIWNK